MIDARTLEDRRHILLRIPEGPISADEWAMTVLEQINRSAVRGPTAQWAELPIAEVAEFAMAHCRRAMAASRAEHQHSFVVVDFNQGLVEIDGVRNHLRILRVLDEDLDA